MLHHPPSREKTGKRTGKTLACLLFAAAALMTAQRARPEYDPETKDGLLIQHIQQEQDTAEKLRYMEQFAAQYPSHPAIAWVYDQLQPAYLQAKEYDQAMRVGVLLLAIEPENLEVAMNGAPFRRSQAGPRADRQMVGPAMAGWLRCSRSRRRRCRARQTSPGICRILRLRGRDPDYRCQGAAGHITKLGAAQSGDALREVTPRRLFPRLLADGRSGENRRGGRKGFAVGPR